MQILGNLSEFEYILKKITDLTTVRERILSTHNLTQSPRQKL